MAHLLPRPTSREDEAAGYPARQGRAQLPLAPSPSQIAAQQPATSSSSSGPSAPSGVEPPPRPTAEPAEADILCADFLVQVRLHTREGYEEALRLGEEILRLEPGNRLVLEYQEVIKGFLTSFGEYVEQVQARETDPNRTPSEVSTEESEPPEASEDDSQEDVLSEVPTDPAMSPRQVS